jgi:hypothetical protein
MDCKTCSKRGEQKLKLLFDKNKYSRDGRHSNCKECRAAYIEKNKDEIYRKSRAYCKANREHVRALKRAWEARQRRALKKGPGQSSNNEMTQAWLEFQDDPM